MRPVNSHEFNQVCGGVVPAVVLAKGAVDCGLGAVYGGVGYFGAKAADGGGITAGGVFVSVFGGCATNLSSGGWALGYGAATATTAGLFDGYSSGTGAGGELKMLLESIMNDTK